MPLPANLSTVLLDLDGTLVDNFEAIYLSYHYATEQLGLEPVDYATVRATVGGSIVVTMERLVGPELAERGVTLFRERFPEVMLEGLRALNGALALLEKFSEAGIAAAVFTNKDGPAARQICEHLGLDRWLAAVAGTNDTPHRKPQPEFTEHILSVLDARPESTLLIGDSPFDLSAAQTHDLACHLVATGSHTEAQLRAEDPAPDGVWSDLHALAKGVFGWELPEPAGVPG
ncbi:MAG: HAD family hydrolase [Opitutales bacterium]